MTVFIILVVAMVVVVLGASAYITSATPTRTWSQRRPERCSESEVVFVGQFGWTDVSREFQDTFDLTGFKWEEDATEQVGSFFVPPKVELLGPMNNWKPGTSVLLKLEEEGLVVRTISETWWLWKNRHTELHDAATIAATVALNELSDEPSDT